MLTYPHFFIQSDKSKLLCGDNPITSLASDNNFVDLTGFLSTYKNLIDSGNLFEYENFDYKNDTEVLNNLDVQRYIYGDAAGKPTFKRYDRFDDLNLGPLNLRVYNKKVGWFDEIKEAFPDLVDICNRFIVNHNVNVFAINILYVQTSLPYHLDADGFYGFRLRLNDSNFKFDFKRLFEETKEKTRLDFFQGRSNSITNNLTNFTESQEINIRSDQLGNAFVINSSDYLHQFSTVGLTIFASIYGIF